MSPSTSPASDAGGGRRSRRRGERHERSLATRQAVVVAAAERFAMVGYHGATLSEIVSLSGVTKGAMYFHFPNKEAVADAVIAATDGMWTALVAELDDRGRDPLHTVVVLTERVVDRVRHDPVVRGGVRLLNDAAVAVRHGAAHYRLAEHSVATLLWPGTPEAPPKCNVGRLIAGGPCGNCVIAGTKTGPGVRPWNPGRTLAAGAQRGTVYRRRTGRSRRACHARSVVEIVAVVVGLVALTAVVRAGARRLGVPDPIALLVVGIGVSWVPGVPPLRIDPDLVLVVLLPVLLYCAAFAASLPAFPRSATRATRSSSRSAIRTASPGRCGCPHRTDLRRQRLVIGQPRRSSGRSPSPVRVIAGHELSAYPSGAPHTVAGCLGCMAAVLSPARL